MAHAERLAEDLEKPLLDNRSYRVIRLPNKLEALLVHDPETDKASASVNVNVGNFSDEEDMPGMAHAVEHLLFMGTEKFPSENAYNVYLNNHSGHSNAYTAATETNYYFECAASLEAGELSNGVDGVAKTLGVDQKGPLYGALDRFAQFFVAPLFLESTLDRELRAVDSENKKNLQSDQWRLSQLSKTLANPDHPYHKFSTGNLKTLRDDPLKRNVKIREAFIAFYERHYSANRMKLVVLGREPLDELESWVTELFSNVKNKELVQNRWDGVNVYTANELSTQVFAKPVMESRSLEMYFPYRDEEEMFESQPSRYISHLIGHEGPGSILAYLKEKGWANGLSSGAMPLCPGSAFFTVSIRLTPDGFKHYQDVVKTVFQYISLMQEAPPQKWIFDEMKDMAEVDFRFKQKSPASRFTSRMSSVMQKPLPRSWLLSGLSKIRKFDPTAISQAMQLLRPDNFRMIIVTQDYQGGWDQKETWYGTDYKIDKISTDFSSELRQALQSKSGDRPTELHLPHKNEFIPTRLTVDKKEVSEPTKAPKLVRNDEQMRLWHKKDDTFWVPKGSIVVNLRNPLAYSTPANYVKTTLYCMLVQDALSEYSYDAEISGLDYHLSGTLGGLNVHVNGYNDKMPVLLEKVLTSMRDLEVRQDRFEVIKERLQRSYKNWEYQQPYHMISAFTRWLTAERLFINDEYSPELAHIQPEDIRAFFPQLLAQAHLEILAHGNLYKEEALSMTKLVEDILHPRVLPASQWSIKRNMIIPAGSDYTYQRQLKDPANVNHCIEYFLYVGAINDRDLRAKLQLLAQMTDEPAFNQLRTKEQLGYVVWSGVRPTATTMGYRVIIQSEQSADYLETRINAFLSKFGEDLVAMSPEDFESHRRSLINRRQEKLKNLESETSRFSSHIDSEFFDFYQVEEDVAKIRTLTKADMIDFFRQFIDPKSTTRAKLSIHLVAASQAPEPTEGDIEEQRGNFEHFVAQALKAAGVNVEISSVNEAFNSIDITAANQESMLSAIRKLLPKELSADQTDSLVEQGKQMLPQILAGLGIKSPVKDALPQAEDALTKPTTIIEEVHEWKAKLEVSAGPSPVTDLSYFQDNESKL